MAAGRPTLYRVEYAEQVYKLCLLGATDKDIADFFEIEESTVNNWKIEFPEFIESIKKGKIEADANVANRLYLRAMGYEHPETITATYQGKITDKMEVTKHYAPDPTAAIFWLKNRQKNKWADTQAVEHTGTLEIVAKQDWQSKIAQLDEDKRERLLQHMQQIKLLLGDGMPEGEE